MIPYALSSFCQCNLSDFHAAGHEKNNFVRASKPMVQASRRDARKLTSAAFRGLKPHGYPQQTAPRSPSRTLAVPVMSRKISRSAAVPDAALPIPDDLILAKYIVIEREGREFPLVFPRDLQHSDVLPPKAGTPVSAGFYQFISTDTIQIRAFTWAKATRLPSIYRNAMGPKSAQFS